jgi:CMP-N,N'-diacetyllegionaminic acid synthase
MAETGRRAIAIVPARGGSKRVPGKNARLLAGRPLLHYTLDCAVTSGCFDTIVLSTDEPAFTGLAEPFPSVLVSLRDPQWATDEATVFDFLAHLLASDPLAQGHDLVALLLPTVPFRRPETIRKAMQMLDADCDAVVGFSRYDFPPQFAVTIDGASGLIRPEREDSPLLTGRTRSQAQAPMFHPNGAVFCAWVDAYRRLGSFYRGRCRALVLDAPEDTDIDTEQDFAYAEYLAGGQAPAS